MTNHSNLVVLTGTITLDPTLRELRTGSVLQFDLSTVLGDSTTASVPVAWHQPTDAQVAAVGAGHEVVVVGTVRRRFFRVGGQTQSRTEVIVSTLLPARRKKTVASLLAATAATINPGVE